MPSDSSEMREFRLVSWRLYLLYGELGVAVLWNVLSVSDLLSRGPNAMSLVTLGVPIAMVWFLARRILSLPRRILVDDFAIKAEGPLGTKEMRWDAVSRYEFFLAEGHGIVLVANSGEALSIDEPCYEDRGALHELIMARVPKPQGQGSILARHMGARVLPALTAGIMVVFAVLFITIADNAVEPLISFGLVMAMLVPLSVYAVTYRASLMDGVLTVSSCFGKTSVVLMPGLKVRTEVLNGRYGPSETLEVTTRDGTSIAIDAGLPEYPLFRAAIFALTAPDSKPEG